MATQPKQDESNGTANLRWPPNKGDLEHLYLEERHSAQEIARLYEAVPSGRIFYLLKKYGIPRRSAGDAARKTTDGLVDEWERRYQDGETARQIAGDSFSENTVLYQLHKRGIIVRTTS